MESYTKITAGPFTYHFQKHSLCYRIQTLEGRGIGHCYSKETAEMMVEALNAYRGEVDVHLA